MNMAKDEDLSLHKLGEEGTETLCSYMDDFLPSTPVMRLYKQRWALIQGEVRTSLCQRIIQSKESEGCIPTPHS